MDTRLPSVSAVLVTAVLAGGLLVGCSGGENPPGTASPSRGPSATGSAPSAVAPSSSAPSDASSDPAADEGNTDAPGGTAQPPRPSAGVGEIVVTGDVEDGVEPGCLVLRTPDRTYLLVGGDRAKLAAGGHTTVRGRAEPGMMTTCQQGIPLRVLEIQR